MARNKIVHLGESIGVTEISKYLDKNNVKYIREWSHPKLLYQYGYVLRISYNRKSEKIVNELSSFINKLNII